MKPEVLSTHGLLFGGLPPVNAPLMASALTSHAAESPAWPDFLVGQADKPVRVLLVDDDPCVRRVIAQELLSDLRIHLQSQTGSMKEARRMIALHDFDVLIVNIRLGDDDGLDLLLEARRRRHSAEIIVISAVEDEEQVLRAFEMGATGFLLKDAWSQSYVNAVLQVANGGASITPRLTRRLLGHFDRRREAIAAPTKLSSGTAKLLSPREREVIQLVAAGKVTNEIGRELGISAQTVNAHIKNIYRKLHVHTRAQAVSYVSQFGHS